MRGIESLPDETVIDGEIIAFDSDGRPSFNVLQNQLSDSPPLRFCVRIGIHVGDVLFSSNDSRRHPRDVSRS